jgi:hypothetical protein
MFLFFLNGARKAVILILKIPKSKPSFFFDIIEFGINQYIIILSEKYWFFRKKKFNHKTRNEIWHKSVYVTNLTLVVYFGRKSIGGIAYYNFCWKWSNLKTERNIVLWTLLIIRLSPYCHFVKIRSLKNAGVRKQRGFSKWLSRLSS